MSLSKLNKVKKDFKYLPDEGLVLAMEASAILQQPLLIMGEPGVGKTEFATFEANRLGLPLFKFECKSITEANDLFYHYDAIGRLQAKDFGQDVAPLNFIKFNALGKAIVQSNITQYPHLLSTGIGDKDKQSVVLIDEIDKAPYDFPNDILNEIDRVFFRIPEAGSMHIQANPNKKPLIIITSNSEKKLPKAFLRRCIFYFIPFPNRAKLEQIISANLYINTNDEWVNKSLNFFYGLRDARLNKTPSTAEFLSWLQYLMVKDINDDNYLDSYHLMYNNLGILLKSNEDVAIAQPMFSTIFKQ